MPALRNPDRVGCRRRTGQLLVPALSALAPEKLGVCSDVLLHRLSGLTGEGLDVVGGPVVAVLAMEPRHRRDVLLDVIRQPGGPQVLPSPLVVWRVLRRHRPSQRARVMLGKAVIVQYRGA